MLRSIPLALFSVIAFLAMNSGAAAQDPGPTIRKAVSDRDDQTAIRLLEDLKLRDRNTFGINNYDYLLGRLKFRNGDLAGAAVEFDRCVSRSSVLKPYALWHLSRIASASGNLTLERVYLQEIMAIAPDSIPAAAANGRLTRSLFESGDLKGTIQRLTAGGALAPGSAKSDPLVRENLVILAEAYLRAGRLAEARETFLRLVNELPNPAQPDDFALDGAIGLDRLDAGTDFGKSAPQLADHLHLQRALIFQFNRDFADARLHYRAIIERYPDSGNVPDAMFQIGRGFAQQRNFREAADWFDRLIAAHPDSPSAKDAIPQSASAHSRLGNTEKAVDLYRKFIERFPDDERLDRAYLNAVDALRDAGDTKRALEWTAKTQEAFRGKLPEASAVFSQLRIRVAAGDWANALSDADRLLGFPELGGTRIPGGTTVAEVRFIRAFVLENLGRTREAVDAYLSIPDGRSEYYGWKSTERLRSMSADVSLKGAVDSKANELRRDIASVVDAGNAEKTRIAVQALYRLTGDRSLLPKIARCYELLEQYRQVPTFRELDFGRQTVLGPSDRNNGTQADELLFLGLFDEAAPELERELKLKGTAISGDVAYTLAVLFRRGDIAHRSVGFIEPVWRKIPADFQIELIPRDHGELLFPAPFAASLLKHASSRAVDPRFVLSIMRQESRFRADVKSVAAARGLMQFISTTSSQIATELGRSDFRQDELYDPATAILFGSQYLANLYRLFPAKHEAVAAAYNGGEDNMRRWMDRARSDAPERYVPEIVFGQSKDYAWKVSANFRIYQLLYNEVLKRTTDPVK